MYLGGHFFNRPGKVQLLLNMLKQVFQSSNLGWRFMLYQGVFANVQMQILLDLGNRAGLHFGMVFVIQMAQ